MLLFDPAATPHLHHRHHLVWAEKYRFKVLHGAVRLQVARSAAGACRDRRDDHQWALSRDRVHVLVEIPVYFSVADFMRRAKGGSSRKIQ